MFPHLADLVIGSVRSEARGIVVHVASTGAPVACPGCGAVGRVHGYVDRQLADLPLAGQRVLVRLRFRRLRCATLGCERQTFREPLPGLAEPYQRRTIALARQVGAVVRELAGRAGSRLLAVLGVGLSRQSAIRSLLGLSLPVRPVPAVIGVDDFALRKRHRYATVIIDAITRERVDVLADRQADTLEAWLRAHRGARVVCRDSSGAYAEAIRRALPEAVQVGDRWHIWHNLAEAVVKEVAAHSVCWGKSGPPPKEGVRAASTRERWQQVRALLDQGVGLLECARRLGLALNTVKRYARVGEPERLVRVPKYRPTLVDPFRDHLRRRRAEDPAVPIQHLLAEIKNLGYTGSQNLLYRYINQGRVECDRPAISPKRLAGLLLTEPSKLTGHHTERLDAAITACHEMAMLAGLVRDFAALLDPKPGNDQLLTACIDQTRQVDLPHLHAFTRGLDYDRDAVNAALTLPFHNGGTEGVNTKTKMIKRQMYGRAGFALLRHRILLG
ncbi:ISL3 family transposase [Sphaerisporangium corydalis]|uniref:ISL3 family transposase n=1 Tax=Sphaerisporangium corydalis TaxID=1441875 RepID=A0ABV9EMT1_9ACTN|nr:ISL3 family transposase [Sphaerisporangium corydalis]